MRSALMICLLGIGIHTYTGNTLTEHHEANKTPHKKSIAALITAAAIPVAYVSYVALSFIATLSHELGHAFMHKVSTGNNSSIEFYINPVITDPNTPLAHKLGASAYPLYGATISAGESFSKLSTAAGPLAGIATSYGILVLVQYMQAKLANRSFCLKQLNPFAVFKDIYSFVAKTITGTHPKKPYSHTFLSRLASLTSWLMVSRMIGETLYGLTPLGGEVPGSDGEKVWGFSIKSSLVGLTLIPTAVAIACGAIKGIYQKLHLPSTQKAA